jgi:CheY-like chemotaxis protein
MRTRSPRLLILDHMMPDVNGLELLESIRRDPRLRHTHAVIYSGADGDAERGRANELGSAWLVKGAALEALIAHVRREYGMA